MYIGALSGYHTKHRTRAGLLRKWFSCTRNNARSFWLCFEVAFDNGEPQCIMHGLLFVKEPAPCYA